VRGAALLPPPAQRGQERRLKIRKSESVCVLTCQHRENATPYRTPPAAQYIPQRWRTAKRRVLHERLSTRLWKPCTSAPPTTRSRHSRNMPTRHGATRASTLDVTRPGPPTPSWLFSTQPGTPLPLFWLHSFLRPPRFLLPTRSFRREQGIRNSHTLRYRYRWPIERGRCTLGGLKNKTDTRFFRSTPP
jgi:hypothetical protein